MTERNKGLARLIISTAVIVLVITAMHATAAENSLQIEGSTTVGPIGDAFKEALEEIYDDINITVNKTGSGDGAAALVDDRCDIAMMSRFMKETEFRNAVSNGVLPVAHVVAMDGVCVVVHPSNPVMALSSEQIRDIYKGKIKNWSELGGPDTPIVAISRDTSSGTYETFHKLLMKKEKMHAGVEYVNSNPQAHARVSKTIGAIGYVGLGFVDRKVRALGVDKVEPSRQTIANGKYPISRPLFLFTNGYPKLGTTLHHFCAFYLSEKGQEIVEAKGFVPVTNY
jgi:phosphate transport system substrate-binding protein